MGGWVGVGGGGGGVLVHFVYFWISSNSSRLTGVCMLASVIVYCLDVNLDYMPRYYVSI